MEKDSGLDFSRVASKGISGEPGSEGTGEGRIRGSFRGWPLGALRAPQLPTTATRGSSGLSGTSLRCPALRASPAGPPVRVPGPPRPRPAPSPPAPGALPASSPWRRVTARPASARLLPRLRPYANQLGGGGEAAGARPPPQQSCSRRSEARPLGPGARAGPGAVGSSRGELLGSPLPGAEGAEVSGSGQGAKRGDGDRVEGQDAVGATRCIGPPGLRALCGRPP